MRKLAVQNIPNDDNNTFYGRTDNNIFQTWSNCTNKSSCSEKYEGKSVEKFFFLGQGSNEVISEFHMEYDNQKQRVKYVRMGIT
jgi:hypothetical protein